MSNLRVLWIMVHLFELINLQNETLMKTHFCVFQLQLLSSFVMNIKQKKLYTYRVRQSGNSFSRILSITSTTEPENMLREGCRKISYLDLNLMLISFVNQRLCICFKLMSSVDHSSNWKQIFHFSLRVGSPRAT